MGSALTASDLADGVHPNAGGYTKMGAVWDSALRTVPGSIGSTSPPVTPTDFPPSSTPPPASSTPPPPPASSTPPPPAGSGCRVSYTVNAWNSGLTTAISVTNTGSSAINGWKLTFQLPAGQTITSGWNATYAPASGAVTATNVSYNGSLAPGATVGFGFQATHTGNAGRPAAFTLNSQACSIA
jgi:hypothetical protein